MKTKHSVVISFAPTNTNINLEYDVMANEFIADVPNSDIVRYLKGIYRSKEQFKKNFIDRMISVTNDPLMPKWSEEDINTKLFPIKNGKKDLSVLGTCKYPEFDCSENILLLLDIYDDVKPFSYAEAFKIEKQEFQALVFGSINISEMIKELGHKRIKTDGKPVRHKQFDKQGNFTGYKEYDVVYELHEVYGEKLGINQSLYAVKCWCTTTNKDHWIWVEDKYKDNVLEAVASTFRIHPNIIPYIKELKRQGDILLVELTEDVKPEGNELVPLTAEQYFTLLTAQS